MATTRWRVMLSSTTNKFLAYVWQVKAPNQLQAEGRACNLLRAFRLTDPAGTAWDRWDLGARHVGVTGWTHVARGDWKDTTWTTRQRHPRESVDGHP